MSAGTIFSSLRPNDLHRNTLLTASRRSVDDDVMVGQLGDDDDDDHDDNKTVAIDK